MRPINSPELVISSPSSLPQRIAPLFEVTLSVPSKLILFAVIALAFIWSVAILPVVILDPSIVVVLLLRAHFS